MDLPSFRRLVAEAERAHPVWFSLERDPPASAAAISQAELALGVTFPPEYREFLREFGGGYFAFANTFSVAPGSHWDVVARNQALAGLLSQHFLAVSDNGAGDFYGFVVEAGVCDPTLRFWDHEACAVASAPTYSGLFEFLSVVGLKAGPSTPSGHSNID